MGGAVGPDLTSLRNKFDVSYLIESIIDPSKNISDQYGSSVVKLKDGETLAGLVIEKGGMLTIYSADVKATPKKVKRSEVESIEQSPISQMPPSLINMLNPKELADLTAYLMSGGDPKAKIYK